MSPRVLVLHIMFCVLALGFAWQQTQAVEKKSAPTSTILLEANKGDVQKVVFTWPKGSTTTLSKGAEAARTVTVDVARELDPPKKKKDDPPDAGPVEAVPAPREEAHFPGGKTVVTALEALEPLKTRRTLGEVDPGRLKEMGLVTPERSLVLTTSSGKTLELEIGEASYGGQGRYARVKGSTTVHLLDPAIINGFEGGADNLLEKRIVTQGPEDILGFTLKTGEKERAFIQKDREQTAKRKVVPKDDPASIAEEPGKALTSIRNLRATKLVTDAKLAGGPTAVISLDVEGREPLRIEILERTDGAGHLVKTGGFLFEISETQFKELQEDLDAV